MNNKKIIALAITTVIISGCISSTEFNSLKRQVSDLNSKSNILEQDMVSVKNELSVVKGQRIVKLPTGAPTSKRVIPVANMSSEEKEFNHAVSILKSGDTKSAITLLENFNNSYPNSKHQPDVLYRLGQASYITRDYNRSRQVLEELIYQNSSTKVNPNAYPLLKRVYKAQGNNQGLRKLEERISANTNTSRPDSTKALQLQSPNASAPDVIPTAANTQGNDFFY